MAFSALLYGHSSLLHGLHGRLLKKLQNAWREQTLGHLNNAWFDRTKQKRKTTWITWETPQIYDLGPDQREKLRTSMRETPQIYRWLTRWIDERSSAHQWLTGWITWKKPRKIYDFRQNNWEKTPCINDLQWLTGWIQLEKLRKPMSFRTNDRNSAHDENV